MGSISAFRYPSGTPLGVRRSCEVSWTTVAEFTSLWGLHEGRSIFLGCFCGAAPLPTFEGDLARGLRCFVVISALLLLTVDALDVRHQVLLSEFGFPQLSFGVSDNIEGS